MLFMICTCMLCMNLVSLGGGQLHIPLTIFGVKGTPMLCIIPTPNNGRVYCGGTTAVIHQYFDISQQFEFETAIASAATQ